MGSDSSLTKDFEELKKLTEEFERGDVDLEKGIPKFKRGLELARQLKKRLGETENEIIKIRNEFKDLEEKSQPVEDEPEQEDERTKGIPF